MAISFQYNKTSLQGLEKNLKMRVRALPTIKNKESALRLEVKRAKEGYLLSDKVGFPRREWQVEVNSGWILLAKDLSEIKSL